MTRGDGFGEKEKNTRMAEYGRGRTYRKHEENGDEIGKFIVVDLL